MDDTAKPARPLAPGPSLEDQLRKAVDASRDEARRQGVRLSGVGSAGAFKPYHPSSIGEQRPLPSGQYIANRLARALDRLRAVESYAEAIAVTLAGPGTASQLGAKPPPDTPAASLFVIYERTLDEIDQIIDNIENEQARTRNILGD